MKFFSKNELASVCLAPTLEKEVKQKVCIIFKIILKFQRYTDDNTHVYLQALKAE